MTVAQLGWMSQLNFWLKAAGGSMRDVSDNWFERRKLYYMYRRRNSAGTGSNLMAKKNAKAKKAKRRKMAQKSRRRNRK